MAQLNNLPKENLKGWAMLCRYVQLRKQLSNAEERLEAMRASAAWLGAIKYDGEPVDNSGGISKQERMIAHLEGLEKNLAQIFEEEGAAYGRLTALLSHLPKEEELLLTMRYMDGKRWNDVNRAMYGERSDFDKRQRNYLKTIFKKHLRALRNLEKLLDTEDPTLISNKSHHD